MKTKSKLMAAVAMLLVSTVMMASASFAWFTISTAPEISNMKTKVAANGNLEIALDATGYDGTNIPNSMADDGTLASDRNVTWGNLVDLNTAFTTGDAKDIELKPVTYDATNKTFKIPSFGLDGRVSAVNDATKAGTGLVLYKDGNTETSKIWAFSVDFWLRSNVEGDITLGAAQARGAGQDGLGSFITNGQASPNTKAVTNVTVAFLVGDTLIKAEVAEDTGALTLPEATPNLISYGTGTGKTALNTAVKVTMFVYMDGASMTNADFANAVGDMSLNVQFDHNATLVPMTVTGTENGRS